MQVRKFDSLNKLNNEKIDDLKSKASQKVDEINSNIEKISAKIEKYEEDLANYSKQIKRFDVVKKWHVKLKAREEGKEKAKLPKETSRIKKLREAVSFMCFWRGYDYDNFCIERWFELIPLKEASEHFLEILLKAGKCDLKACWDFEITKKGVFKKLGKKQIQNRLDKGTYWLSREKYELLTDPSNYDYK